MKNIYSDFQNDISDTWGYKCYNVFIEANHKIYKHTKKQLAEPTFNIIYSNSLLGQWNPDGRILSLSFNLLTNYEWKAVEHTIFHEVAHMVVNEIFDLRIEGVSHGESFKKACNILEIDSSRCLNNEYLKDYKSAIEEPIVEKIQKLLIKGNCSSITQEEANLFLEKAQELMIRNQIDPKSINGCDSDKLFLMRPVGRIYKNIPKYVFAIGQILREFYFTRYIQSYAYVTRNNQRRRFKRIELFGTPSNLEISEYLYHGLLLQGERLWKEFCVKKKSEGNYIRGNYSKSQFLQGLYSGYYNDLESKRGKIEEADESLHSLIHVGDKLLDEMFKKQYHPKNLNHSTRSNCGGYNSGVEYSKNIRINPGINNGHSSSKKQLTA